MRRSFLVVVLVALSTTARAEQVSVDAEQLQALCLISALPGTKSSGAVGDGILLKNAGKGEERFVLVTAQLESALLPGGPEIVISSIQDDLKTGAGGATSLCSGRDGSHSVVVGIIVQAKGLFTAFAVTSTGQKLAPVKGNAGAARHKAAELAMALLRGASGAPAKMELAGATTEWGEAFR